jgi:hypothetical protein
MIINIYPLIFWMIDLGLNYRNKCVTKTESIVTLLLSSGSDVWSSPDPRRNVMLDSPVRLFGYISRHTLQTIPATQKKEYQSRVCKECAKMKKRGETR